MRHELTVMAGEKTEERRTGRRGMDYALWFISKKEPGVARK
jgi:hypothetical protein